MHIKHMHEMIEKLAEYGKCMVEAGAGSGDVNVVVTGQIVDMIKDLACAEKDARICKAMEKEEEEEKEEEKRLLKMLKEEHGDEYKRMREEYGEDEGERRFYDNYRHANGRFARKGTGSYRPRSSGRRRGYEEPPYLHMPLDYRMDMEDYTAYPPEYWRDMDRGMGKMYYTDGGSGGSYGGNSGGNSGQSGNMGGSGMNGGNSGGNVRGYSDGYNDGYREGERSGRSSGGRRDGREGRSGQSRRSYMETKEANKGNSPQEKQEKMKELEKYMKELAEDVTEMIEDATPEERSLAKQKMQVLLQKL